jgi:putative ABC transport system permease protein
MCQKMHLALNVGGLAVGVAATLLVLLYLQFELSYDRFQPNVESSYRLAQVHKDTGELNDGLIAKYQATLAVQRIAEQMPEVEALFSLSPLTRGAGMQVEIEGEYFRVMDLYAATPNMREFVAVEVIAGSLEAALGAPEQIALSRSQAIRLFGRVDAVGGTITHEEGKWTVAAVFEDLPTNTHFNFTALTYANPNRDPERVRGHTYVRLAPQTDLALLSRKIQTQINAQSFQPWLIGLLPLRDIHLKSDDNQKTVTICIALAVLLIGIAAFNFINMSTAQAGQRAREIGVRKALGASRPQLVAQFLVESTLVACVAGLGALLLVYLCMPWFTQLVNTKLHVNYLVLGIDLLAITAIVGVLAGLYPALFVSSFDARRVLSGDFQRGSTAVLVRKILLSVQWVLSVCLIVGTLVVFKQIQHLRDLPVGYAKTHRMEVRGLKPERLFVEYNPGLIAHIEGIDGVISATPFDRSLTEGSGSVVDIIYPNAPDTKNAAGFTATGFNFVETVGLRLLAGRDFGAQFPGDWAQEDEQGVGRASIVITQSMARAAGYTTAQDAVGQVFRLGIDGREADFLVTVVGVVDDIKLGSVKVQQYPIFFICGFSWAPDSTLVVHVENSEIPRIRGEVSAAVKKYLGVANPDIRLVEDNYEAIYQYERRQGQLVLAFAGLAIFLTCVGLFGLAAFSTQRRYKEIAIRKTLGASRLSLVNLLSGEYLILIVPSLLVAFPLAFYLTSDWLENFNERVGQSAGTYLLAGLMTAGVAWLTIALLAVRATSIRPWITLRYD